MHDLGGGLAQHGRHIREAGRLAEPLGQLPRHQNLMVTNGDQPRLRQTGDRLGMLVGNLAATNEGDAKHGQNQQLDRINIIYRIGREALMNQISLTRWMDESFFETPSC